MARRKSKAKPRSRSKPQINLLNIGESALLANAVTQGLFNTNLKDFIMGTRDGAYVAGFDGASRLTLPEIFGVGKTPFGGEYQGSSAAPPVGFENFTSTVMSNAKNNFMTMGVSLILIPIGFTVASKLTKKPRATTNKMLKMTGLGVKV
tara:strand:- start:690 stop:1136 length:447 start_codon:yes stop_codon:yes gene_type:complete